MEYALTINDAEQNLDDGPLSLRTLVSSWTQPRQLEFVEHAPHHDASFFVEDRVTLEIDGAVRFRGRIKEVQIEGVPGREHVAYVCLGLRELAKDVCVRDPDHGVPRVAFNAPEHDEDYSEAMSGLAVGEIIGWLFDNHADELRSAGVIGSAPATGYIQAELDALDVVPPKIVLNSLDFDAALAEVMAFQPGHRMMADPATQTFRFRELATLPAATITYNSADRPLSSLLRPSTRGRATAVEIHGPMQPVNETASLADNSLVPLWDSQYETDWTWEKCLDANLAETYGVVYRRFQIADESRRRMARTLSDPASLGGCPATLSPQVYRKTADGTWLIVPAAFDFENGIVTLAQPATTGDEYAEGAAACADDIALLYAWLDKPLTARSPSDGYDGTAYSDPENPVEIVRHIYDEAFVLPSQTEQYEALAHELLKSTQDIAYGGRVQLAALNFSLVDLAARVNFTGRDDDGNAITTGFESLGAYIGHVHYDFAAGRTELHLSTDQPEPEWRPSADRDRLAEAATQLIRTTRLRAAQSAVVLPTARAGNDGEFGADATIRGVYSIQVAGDEPADRMSGHIDLEAGDGIEITRQSDDDHNGFRIEASCRGNWHWFHYRLYTADVDTAYDMHARGDYDSLAFYPVLAGRVTRVIAYSPQHLDAGEVHVTPIRNTRAEGAACPEQRSELSSPDAALTTTTNTGYANADPGADFVDQDVLGLRISTTAAFRPASAVFDVIAGAYFEED